MTNPAAASPSRAYLEVRSITKRFGRFTALDDVSLTVERGEMVCILGPSGCGKSTLLRILAGLETAEHGTVWQDGRDITRLRPAARDFGIVFQSYALFPNLTAARNIAFGMECRRMGRDTIARRVDELLELVGLPDAHRKYPAQLSGGQQQRVALARALALSPGLLLLDEPLSALDAAIRASLRRELRAIQRRLDVTTVMVTHDQTEALTMADRVVVMEEGRIAQAGTPGDVYRAPESPFVAGFIGLMNWIPGIVSADGSAARCGRELVGLASAAPTPAGSSVDVAVRPEAILLSAPAPPSTAHADATRVAADLQATVETIEFHGAFLRYALAVESLGGVRLIADVPWTDNEDLVQGSAPGQLLRARIPLGSARAYARRPSGSQGAAEAATAPRHGAMAPPAPAAR